MNLPSLYKFLCWYDTYWRRKHGVEKFDDLLSLSFENFTGKRRKIADGTWLEPGDKLAILHFNHECFTLPATGDRYANSNALRFRRAFLQSFSMLAKAVNENEKFWQIKAFHGVSWIPPHGQKVGFTIEQLPLSTLNFVRKMYLTLLVKTFFPHVMGAAKKSLQPYGYWLTRQNLLKYFL